MNPKHKHPEVPKENNTDPFINCKLDRKEYAVNLTDVIKFYSDGFVMAINNKWGTGKTTFIKMWQQYLINDGFKTIYFNAWENDYQSDVFIALLAELDSLKESDSKELFESVLVKAKPLMRKVGIGLMKGLSKKIGADVLIQELIEGASETAFSNIEKEIENYSNRRKSIEGFRKELEKLAFSIDNHKPLVFIIDELDRCRPNYAVEVLEQIKHLFLVPGIVFILAIDKEQLSHAVKGVYGNDNIDANEYLRRFIDIEYTIPDPSLEKFIDYLFDYYSFDEFYNTDRIKNQNFKFEEQNLKDIYLSLFSNKISTLRVHEKKFAHMRVLLKTYNSNQYSLPEVVVALLFLKEYNNKIYNSILNKEFKVQELLDELNSLFKNRIGESEKRKIAFAIGRLSYCYCNYLKELKPDEIYRTDSISSKRELILDFKLDQKAFKSSFDYLSNNFDLDNMSLEPLLNKVELLDSLK